MELHYLTIKEARAGLKNRQFSGEELRQACLTRIKKLNPKLNAVLTVIDKPESSRNPNGPLGEIPFSAKDVFVTRGIRTTAGSKVLENYRPEYTATAVERLLDAGAVLIAKDNCDAWGHGSSTENSDFGPSKNPWDVTRVPGGSSGGSAVTVASGLSFFALGEDTGGSIRLPASFCGVTGLKVSYGAVSRYGSIAFASSLDTVGPITRTAADSELVFNVVAGRDPNDATSVTVGPALTRKNLKIGLPLEYFGKGNDPEVEKAVLEAVRVITEGVSGETLSLPHTKYAVAVYYLVATSEVSSNLSRYDAVRYGRDRSYLGAEAKRRIMLGTYALSAGYHDAYYKKAMQVRTLVKRDFERAFKKVDFLITPVSPTTAFKLGEKKNDPLTMYLSDIMTIPVNLAGIPAVSVPCGFSKDGLPIGMQIIGPYGSDRTLLAIAKAYQQKTHFHERHP